MGRAPNEKINTGARYDEGSEIKKNLTRQLITQVLRRITEKASRDASNALRKL